MQKLFEIETDEVHFSWRAPAKKYSCDSALVEGHLSVRAVRANCNPIVERKMSHPSLAIVETLPSAPKIFEETEYRVYAQSKRGKTVSLIHRDPNLNKGFESEDGGRIAFGSVNFRSEVGLSMFTVLVDNTPEFEFEIEVFPSKLDYKTDYQQIIAETQDYVSGLVFEYLRSTYKLSSPVLAKQSSTVEWLLLLNLVLEDLEKACIFLAAKPVRALIREQRSVKADKIRRIDSTIRRAVLRGAGSGPSVHLTSETRCRQTLPSSQSQFVLDTPEHRWIAAQLRRIRERLLSLRQIEFERGATERRQKIISELQALEERVYRLEQLKPFDAATELPPPGFASLQLTSAPGYRECYRLCNLMNLGLKIEGDVLNLSLKELSTLYEYWCFLTVVHLLCEMSGQKLPVHQLVKPTNRGLEIKLKKGIESTVEIPLADNGSIEVIYNRSMKDRLYLVPQQPDILISLKQAGYPKLNLLLDAKYRLENDEQYIQNYNSPGPAIDSVNVLHRYRDAILDSSFGSSLENPKRTIIQAAALFPFLESEDCAYRKSKLWTSLDRLGIGAIPLLPDSKQYLQEWLAKMLRNGGWSLADRVIGHRALERITDYRIAASEPVLIGVLNATNSAKHLEWIKENRMYYMPLLKNHPRQLAVKHVAIYSPAELRGTGAVSHRARVSSIQVMRRVEIKTPWVSASRSDGLCVVYALEMVQALEKTILNKDETDRGARVSTPRWASRLSLERASNMIELFLESEAEWRLYEGLKSAGVRFKLRSAPPNALVLSAPSWRTNFDIAGGASVRYHGEGGYQLQNLSQQAEYFSSVEDVIRALI